jgi:acyl-CoA thioester hydrolase
MSEPTKDDAPQTRASYTHFAPIPTRWMDNDVYGHVNNVVYYAYFDTVINRYLIAEGKLDIARGAVIGIFGMGEETAAAEGSFVHVFVDRETRRSAPIPDAIRSALARIAVAADA